MTLGTIFYLTIFVIGREGHDPSQAVAEQTILTSLQGMGDSGAFWFILSRGFFIYLSQLVTEEALIILPFGVILRERHKGSGVVAI
jgi:hypothetical protein